MLKKIKFEYLLSILYIIVGGLWILYSDLFVSNFTRDPKIITQIQHYKGWFYVFTTGILLFFLVKNHIQKIRKAEAKAKENDRLKTAFIQNISHELRTPMNSIIGFSELAQTEKTENEILNLYLQTILNSSKQLLFTINDVMDASLLESGNMYLNISEIKLNHFLNSFYNSYEPLMDSGVKLYLSGQFGHPLAEEFTFTSDEEKLRRVINNLLNNAIKFTQSGFIEYGCITKNNHLEFYVKDTGPGIEKSMLEDIFNRFVQTENTVKECKGGTGLGLAICKDIIELHQGRIWVESDVNVGSTFWFTIPLKLTHVSYHKYSYN